MNSAEIEFHRWTPSGYSWQIPAAQFTDYWIHCSLLIFNHYLYEHPQHSSDSGGVEKDFLSLTRRCRSVNVRFFFVLRNARGCVCGSRNIVDFPTTHLLRAAVAEAAQSEQEWRGKMSVFFLLPNIIKASLMNHEQKFNLLFHLWLPAWSLMKRFIVLKQPKHIRSLARRVRLFLFMNCTTAKIWLPKTFE